MKIIKDLKKNTYILLIVTFIVLFFVLKDDFDGIFNILIHVNLWYILIALLLLILSVILKSYVLYKTIDDKKKYTFKTSIIHNFIVSFFNGITPFSTGGQPMEVYMLSRYGININNGTMIILENFIFYQIALVILGLVAVLYNYYFQIFPKVPFLRKLLLIGFLINTLVCIFILLVSISKKITKKIFRLFVKFLYKIKIVKNLDRGLDEIEVRLNEFYLCAEKLRKRKGLLFLGVFFNLLSLICVYSIPLFVAYSLNSFNTINFFECVTASAYVYVIGSFVPIPGASGGIEYGFISFFQNFFSSSLNSSVLIIWRFITYYLDIIIGAIVFNISNKKYNDKKLCK